MLPPSPSPSQASLPSLTLCRSGRSRTGTPSTSSHLDKPPCTPEEKLQHQLDIAPIPARSLVAADDILVPIFNNARVKLHVHKIGNGCKTYSRAPVSKQDFDRAFKRANNLESATRGFTEKMKSEWTISSNPEDSLAVMNLCIRYAKFRYSTRVTIAPVKFKDEVEAGIVAKTQISKGTLISELSGIMSSDIVDVPDLNKPQDQWRMRRNNKSFFRPVSIIWGSTGQAGDKVKGDRVLVGPARFVNHSCTPNCKLKPCKKTYAWSIETLREIQPGEEITVSYGEHYFAPGECACASCQLRSRLITPEMSVETNPIPSPKSPKKRKLEMIDVVNHEPVAKRLRSHKKSGSPSRCCGRRAS